MPRASPNNNDPGLYGAHDLENKVTTWAIFNRTSTKPRFPSSLYPILSLHPSPPSFPRSLEPIRKYRTQTPLLSFQSRALSPSPSTVSPTLLIVLLENIAPRSICVSQRENGCPNRTAAQRAGKQVVCQGRLCWSRRALFPSVSRTSPTSATPPLKCTCADTIRGQYPCRSHRSQALHEPRNGTLQTPKLGRRHRRLPDLSYNSPRQ